MVDTAHDEGFVKGEQIGLEKGDQAARMAIARSLLDILDVETIALKTGLSVEEIKRV